jgi:hypothetical protein
MHAEPKPRLITSTGVLLLLAVIAGCATTASEPLPPPEDRTFTYEMPLIEPLEQTEELLTMGGVRISLAPQEIQVSERDYCQYEEIRASLRDLINLDLPPSGVTRETHSEFHEVRYRRPVVTTSSISFTATVTNQLERVFRGQGSVFQFSVGGRAIASDNVNYQQFLNAIIPPNGETQVSIRGPTLSSIGDDNTIAVNIYDIMVDTDEAGNVTQRDNAEWYYRVVREPREATVSGERHRVWIPNNEAAGIPTGESLVSCVQGVRE